MEEVRDSMDSLDSGEEEPRDDLDLDESDANNSLEDTGGLNSLNSTGIGHSSVDGSPMIGKKQRIMTSGYDETVDTSDPEDVRDSLDSLPEHKSTLDKIKDSDGDYDDEEIDLRQAISEKTERYGSEPRDSYENNSEDSEDEEDLSMMRGNATSQNFDYSTLNVSTELKELFEYIDKFKPAETELTTKLKPFIPEYLPGVGDIDAFIKIPRPDTKPDDLGLTVLDEPAAKQSDPTVLTLKLRQSMKSANPGNITIRGIENADKHPKAVQQWVARIQELHGTKPPPNVVYSKRMPDIESLMQEWPPELEKLLENLKLPSAELDVDLTNFVKIICAILDIPVHNNIVESLHVLFTLYSAFKDNQHFQNQPKNENKADTLTLDSTTITASIDFGSVLNKM